ncbi:MAG TPA: diacylglycerol kinase family protein [Pyrinomonadaceae bacterium]|jgi:YegS/Rv2252/BmrU family lipid kinase
MSKSNTVLISNPRAGRGGARRALEVTRFREAMRARGVELEVLNTTAQDEATRLAARAVENGAETVIVSGGDGTINEAVQGIVGKQARLAIWPRGTANVLAKEIGMPFHFERAAEIIARGKTKRIYPGCATLEETGERRYFILMAGIGLDASVVEGTRPELKRRFGKAAFWYAGLEHLARWQPVRFNLEVGGETFPATFAAIGKGSRYGGGLRITPRARLDEPDFEICIANYEGRLKYLRLLPATLSGNLAEHAPDLRFIRATRARVTGRVAVQVDGELIGKPPMSFEVVKEPIEIICP